MDTTDPRTLPFLPMLIELLQGREHVAIHDRALAELIWKLDPDEKLVHFEWPENAYANPDASAFRSLATEYPLMYERSAWQVHYVHEQRRKAYRDEQRQIYVRKGEYEKVIACAIMQHWSLDERYALLMAKDMFEKKRSAILFGAVEAGGLGLNRELIPEFL